MEYNEGNNKPSLIAQVKDGAYYGEYKEFNKNGLLSMSTTYRNNKIVDDIINYYPNGSVLMKLPFDTSGTAEGTAVGYYEDGKPAFIADLTNNKINGLMRVFYPNGNLKSEKMFKNGNWDGREYREYDEQGNLLYEVSYDGYSARYYKTENGQKLQLEDEDKRKLFERINISDSFVGNYN